MAVLSGFTRSTKRILHLLVQVRTQLTPRAFQLASFTRSTRSSAFLALKSGHSSRCHVYTFGIVRCASLALAVCTAAAGLGLRLGGPALAGFA